MNLEDKLDQFEEDVDSQRAHDHNALSQVRRQTIGLKRYIRPQKEALRALVSQQPSWLADSDTPRINETINHLLRYLEELDLNIERAQIIQQEVASQISDQLNKCMYDVSGSSAVFTPGFLTGLLGVNIGGILERNFSSGIPVVCSRSSDINRRRRFVLSYEKMAIKSLPTWSGA